MCPDKGKSLVKFVGVIPKLRLLQCTTIYHACSSLHALIKRTYAAPSVEFQIWRDVTACLEDGVLWPGRIICLWFLWIAFLIELFLNSIDK